MRPQAANRVISLFLTLGGCLLQPPAERGFGQVGSEDDPEVQGVLRLANTLSLQALKDSVGLHQLVARAIVRHRAGPDGDDGTADDDPIGDLDELGSIEHFGPQAYAKLLDYWQRFIQGQGTWRQGLPTGSFTLSAVLYVLAVDDEAEAEDVVERVLCSLSGENPGRLTIECRRDDTSFGVQADVAADGSFEATLPVGITGATDDKTMRVAGRLGPERAITLDAYQYVAIIRCDGFGACGGDDWRVLSSVRGAEQATATLAVEPKCSPEDPVLEHVRATSTLLVGCPVCTHKLKRCGCDHLGCIATNVCVADRYQQARTVDRSLGCGLWETLADLDCSPADLDVCVAPPPHEPVVPDDEAITEAPKSAGCPQGFRWVSDCRCAGCEPTVVCVDERITGDTVVGYYSDCGLGRHVGRSFHCAFAGFTVCLPD